MGIFDRALKAAGSAVNASIKAGKKITNKTFFEAAISSFVMLAYADGEVSSDEKKKMVAFLQSDDQLKNFDTHDIIARVEREMTAFAFDKDIAIAATLKLLHKITDSSEKSYIVSMLQSVAGADGKVSPVETEVLDKVKLALGL